MVEVFVKSGILSHRPPATDITSRKIFVFDAGAALARRSEHNKNKCAVHERALDTLMIEPTVDDNRTAREVVDAAFAVHSALGPGLLKFAYEYCLAYEMKCRGIAFERQVGMPFVYCGERIEGAYRMDLLVDSRIIVEVKAV